MAQQDTITRDPDGLVGTPVFAGTRVPIRTHLDYLEAGQTLAEIAHFQISDATQNWISQLLDKEDDDSLTSEERHQLDELLIVQDLVTLIRSRVPPNTSTPAAHSQV